MSTSYSFQKRSDNSAEEQIDPSFGRSQEAMQSLTNHLHQDALTENQATSENFDDVAAAAAAVVATNEQHQKTDAQPASEPAHIDDAEPGPALSRAGKSLTNTKRALQNRMAQRAFRQRKEAYIKDLEDKSKEVEMLRKTIDDLRAENIQLRDYSLALQARLIEQPDVPPPPAIFTRTAKKN